MYTQRLTKGTEFFINDFHGEYKGLNHIINIGSDIKELIRSLFLENVDVQSILLSFIYFRDYFNDDEGQSVVNHLFNSQEEFE